MELTILGTAAAEGWPAPFCLCPGCEEARRRRGPNIRARSGCLLDDDLKIDYGPDTVAQMQRTGRSLARVRTILITHHHSDHLVPTELDWAVPPFLPEPLPHRIEVFANAESIDLIHRHMSHHPKTLAQYHFKTVQAGDSFQTIAGDVIHALCADHCDGAMLLHVRRAGRDNKVYFHGHDTGLLPALALDTLATLPPVDVCTLDCTNGPLLHYGERNHMSIQGVIATATELRRRGILRARSRAVATHFSHNGRMLHEELVEAFLPHQIEVAYDGMTIQV